MVGDVVNVVMVRTYVLTVKTLQLAVRTLQLMVTRTLGGRFMEHDAVRSIEV